MSFHFERWKDSPPLFKASYHVVCPDDHRSVQVMWCVVGPSELWRSGAGRSDLRTRWRERGVGADDCRGLWPSLQLVEDADKYDYDSQGKRQTTIHSAGIQTLVRACHSRSSFECFEGCGAWARPQLAAARIATVETIEKYRRKTENIERITTFWLWEAAGNGMWTLVLVETPSFLSSRSAVTPPWTRRSTPWEEDLTGSYLILSNVLILKPNSGQACAL